MLAMIRRLLRIPAPRISAEQALSRARAECDRRGWKWDRPVLIEGLRRWLVWADGTRKPSAFVVLCQQTGEVVRSGRGSR
jgi:hypothetical protein